MSISIRRADAGDADALAGFAERLFRETFGPFNAPDDMDLYCLQAYSPRLQAAEIADASMSTLLAVDGAAIAGYAQLREGPAPAVVDGDAPIELVRFYIDTPQHGRGLAATLMDAVAAEGRARRRRTLWLGVWERNLRALAFYRKTGFADVGSHTFRLGSDEQIDRLMVRGI
jgi:ribosomal protein S18 acetylase RimI-like enzyme